MQQMQQVKNRALLHRDGVDLLMLDFGKRSGETMELEEATSQVQPPTDPRRRLPEVPVVWVDVIEDVVLPCVAGGETETDRLFGEFLRFERLMTDDRLTLVYRAENAVVRLQIMQTLPPKRDLRPLMVSIPHFDDFLKLLIEDEIPYEWQRGITPGTDRLLLRDVSGNWLSVGLRASVM